MQFIVLSFPDKFIEQRDIFSISSNLRVKFKGMFLLTLYKWALSVILKLNIFLLSWDIEHLPRFNFPDFIVNDLFPSKS